MGAKPNLHYSKNKNVLLEKRISLRLYLLSHDYMKSLIQIYALIVAIINEKLRRSYDV